MMSLSLLGSTFISRFHSHCFHNFYVYMGARHAAAVYGGDYYDDGDGMVMVMVMVMVVRVVVVNGRVCCSDGCYSDGCYGDGCYGDGCYGDGCHSDGYRSGHLLTI
jgi:hypothetical protein